MFEMMTIFSVCLLYFYAATCYGKINVTEWRNSEAQQIYPYPDLRHQWTSGISLALWRHSSSPLKVPSLEACMFYCMNAFASCYTLKYIAQTQECWFGSYVILTSRIVENQKLEPPYYMQLENLNHLYSFGFPHSLDRENISSKGRNRLFAPECSLIIRVRDARVGYHTCIYTDFQRYKADEGREQCRKHEDDTLIFDSLEGYQSVYARLESLVDDVDLNGFIFVGARTYSGSVFYDNGKKIYDQTLEKFWADGYPLWQNACIGIAGTSRHWEDIGCDTTEKFIQVCEDKGPEYVTYLRNWTKPLPGPEGFPVPKWPWFN